MKITKKKEKQKIFSIPFLPLKSINLNRSCGSYKTEALVSSWAITAAER